MKKTITGAELLCQCLVKHHVKYLFGYTGGAILPVYDQFPKFPELKHVMARNEQGAAFMAQGWARLTGEVGVCVATSGPGATNLITGIADAQMDSVPVLAITGQVAKGVIGTDAFQEADVVGMMIPITKQTYLLEDARDIPRIVNEAMTIALDGRPGPVHIDIPKDVSYQEIEVEDWDRTVRYSFPQAPGITEEELNQAMNLIERSKKPIIFIGHGVILSKAQEEAQQFIEKTNIPFSSTLHGLSAIPADHPQHLGMMGMHGTVQANRAIQNTDLIISLGMRFDDRVTGKLSEYAKDAQVIHIDIDRAELGKNVAPTVGIHSDLKPALQKMLQHAQRQQYADWYAYAEQNKKDWDNVEPITKGQGLGPEGKLLMGHIIQELSRLTDGQDTILADVGQHQMFVARYYTFRRFNSWLNSGGAGTMGFALPTALGAKLARPDERVWSIVGDGAFQMNIQELGVILEEQIDVKIIVLNNSFLGMVQQWQDLFFEKRFVATPMVNPDFIKIAEAYGIPAERVSKMEEVEPALSRARDHQGAYLLEFETDMEEVIFPMIPSGATFEQMIISKEDMVK